MMVFFKIFFESLRLSFEELRSAKLRSFLSVLGITIGILCVISVKTAVDSLEKNIKDSFETFGGDVLYVQKWPMIFQEDYPWWRYFNRPTVNPKEMAQLKDKVGGAQSMAMVSFNGAKLAKYEDRTIEQVTLTGVTYEYDKVKDMEFSQGRYFTQAEAEYPTYVCIIGAEIAKTLFDGRTKIEGEEIRLAGTKLKVVGVLKREGSNMIGWTLDDMVIIPYSILSNFVNTNPDGGADPLIAVTPKAAVPIEELRYELKGAMRAIRRQAPDQEDNFAINQMSQISEALTPVFSFINFAGFLIGIFSLLVGGFGIANIMFVSVKERTSIIGIKKALGARQSYILLEFLLEAVMLCVMGGIMGLLLVQSFTSLANSLLRSSDATFTFYLTTYNVAYGVITSIIIGILAGIIPAYFAAKMKPVDAIRSN